MTQPGRFGGLAGAVGGLAGALRRRATPVRRRVRLFDEAGHPETLDLHEPTAVAVLDAAVALVAAATPAPWRDDEDDGAEEQLL